MSIIGMEAKRPGNNFQTMDTGPVLLTVEDAAAGQKFEIHVEQDELVGELDQIELSFHMYKHGQAGPAGNSAFDVLDETGGQCVAGL